MKRIQRQRTKGWRMPEGAVYVGRPSQWGNYEATVDAYRVKLVDFVEYGPHGDVMEWLAPLRGRDLVCWCPEPCGADVDLGWDLVSGGPYDPCALPRGHDGYHDPSAQPCHADVLLELAA